MIELLNSIKVEEIYKFDLMSEIDILKDLDLWDSTSSDEKMKYESWYNKLSKIKDENEIDSEDEKLVYGEITKKGVQDLAKEIKEFSGVFYDLGSGNGKLLLHLSLISNFNKYLGVEISPVRCQYALKIKNLIKKNNVDFINDDFSNVNYSDANFIFCNDVMMSSDIRDMLIEKIPIGCYYISFYKSQNEFIKKISLNVSWLENQKVDYNLYRKIS